MKKLFILLMFISGTVNALEAYIGMYGGSSNEPSIVGDSSNWADFGGIAGASTEGNGLYLSADMTLNTEAPVISTSIGYRNNNFIASAGIGYGQEFVKHNTGYQPPFNSTINMSDEYTVYFVDLEYNNFFARYSQYETEYHNSQTRIIGGTYPNFIYGTKTFDAINDRHAIQLGYRFRFK